MANNSAGRSRMPGDNESVFELVFPGIAAQLSAAEQQLVSLQTMLQAQRLDRAELVTTGWTQLLEARRKARAAASWSIAD